MRSRALIVGLLLACPCAHVLAQPGEAARLLNNAFHYENDGYWLAAVAERLWADEHLRSIAARSDNQHQIWTLLRRLPAEQLDRLPGGLPASAPGWWELTRLHNLYFDDPWRYAQALEQWQARHPGHPASESVLLTVRSRLPVIRQHRPGYHGAPVLRAAQRIALVLPMAGETGAAGQAVRDGFVEAARAAGSLAEALLFDSSDSPLNAYARASARASAGDIDLIVGPLDKSSVDQLSRRGGLAIPTLALNYTTQNSAWAPHQLFQFGLAPEDEAATAAEQAVADGARRVAILASDDNWGARGAAAFAAAFAARGGIIVDEQRYADRGDLQQTVRSFLRAGSPQALWQDQRPNKDGMAGQAAPPARIDALFLAARANVARQIRPLLRFYGAVDLPVYATGAVYEPDADSERDHDLRGVVFCDSVPATVPDGLTPAARFPRLHALGRDAFALSQALPSLLLSPNQALQGQTGRLQLDNFRAVRRRPDCQRIAVGSLTPVD